MRLLEQCQIVPVMTGGVLDVRNQTRTGDYVCVKDWRNLAVVVHFADGTAGDDVRVAMYQAKDAAGTDAAVLNCLSTGRIYHKLGAADVTAVGQWTQATQATADELYTHADSGEQSGLYVLEIEASDLTAGFDWVRADIIGIANSAAKLACAEYILWNGRFNHEATVMPSAIA
jgi:hypothetical protein